MKKEIYAIIIGICLLISSLVLTTYYTQNFSSKITFNEELSFTSDYTEYNIKWIESPIGKLTIKNNGIFSQKYILPNFIGCLELKEDKNVLLNKYEFEIYIKGAERNTLEIPVGKEEEYILFAKYFPSQPQLSFKQLEENVEKVLIYEVKKEEKNPLKIDYGYNYETSQQRCERLEKENKPIRTIEIPK